MNFFNKASRSACIQSLIFNKPESILIYITINTNNSSVNPIVYRSPKSISTIALCACVGLWVASIVCQPNRGQPFALAMGPHTHSTLLIIFLTQTLPVSGNNATSASLCSSSACISKDIYNRIDLPPTEDEKPVEVSLTIQNLSHLRIIFSIAVDLRISLETEINFFR